ncbi:UDP-3-O-acyl N-acetylglucosamine deacetylase [Candidatus Omnitrophus magneticus]|uniref:UDP-3-O-acyl-N-acetylglucosamine deacetylase n=1 Tax=Candidatus Omnitrophus magneticus TaxID=1609969 RepID=A0A0F0CKJ0_9BACT|nr:UDP-3-O-acyl N-acetylglucosamine deacetylase [Candidatus Omnitrophus magneticus]
MFVKEHTIKNKVEFSGKSLQRGEEVKVICEGASIGTGIIFLRADRKDAEWIRVGDMLFSDEYERRSTIGKGNNGIQTVEHFLAALWGMGISNMKVYVYGREFPAMDGSAKVFLEILKSGGIVEQEKEVNPIKIKELIEIHNKDVSLSITPSEKFSITYFIDYKCKAIGKEEFLVDFDKISFEENIAGARTFCLKDEAMLLLKLGFGRGATYDNTLIMGDTGPVGTTLRYPNEPLRHKILDLIGDLYLLGRPLIGRVIARKSGHKINMRLVRAIYEKYGNIL